MRSGRLRLLHVEDDQELVGAIRRVLHRYEIESQATESGAEAISLARNRRFHVVLVDWRLRNGPDGLETARQIRAESRTTGIIMLSAIANVESKVKALRESVDDYVVKPVAPSELVARVVAVARRCIDPELAKVRSSDFVLFHKVIRVDLLARQVFVCDAVVQLTPRQYDLLVYLMSNIGRLVDAEELALNVWRGVHHDADSAVIRVQISLLRRALGAAGEIVVTGRKGMGWGIGVVSDRLRRPSGSSKRADLTRAGVLP